MPRAVVAFGFEQPHQVEAAFQVFLAEAIVLVVAVHLLAVQVDVKELAGFERLRHLMREVQPGHGFMRVLRVDADHLGVIEGGDERQHVAGRGEVDVPARLVGFGFQGEFQVVAPVLDVLAQEVHGFAHAFDRFDGVLGRVDFGAFAPAPEDINRRADLDAQVDGVHGLLQGVGPDLGAG